MKKMLVTIPLAVILLGLILNWNDADSPIDSTNYLAADRYPETAQHIQNLIESGHPVTCTFDRTERKTTVNGH